MAQVGNESGLGGEFMIQDRDHEIDRATDKANRGVRQSEQSQTGGRQQGSGDTTAGRQQDARRRQVE